MSSEQRHSSAKGFHHFLEVFGPNVPAGVHRIPEYGIPAFVNDHIVRLLAGIPTVARPIFLKIPYFGPAAMEEICTYDPSLVVGVLGGSAGTTHDAFALLYSAKAHGARVALFGRKINAAEHQLSFVEHLRRVQMMSSGLMKRSGHITPHYRSCEFPRIALLIRRDRTGHGRHH